MTKTFVDSASIHGALGALEIGRERLAETPWEQQSLLEVTYLLLHANVHIVPGPSHYSGPSGPLQHLLQRFPLLEQETGADLRAATARTKQWARGNVKRLSDALTRLEMDPVAKAHCNNQVECFWVHHAQMFGRLFNEDFIPCIANVLGCPEPELRKVCDITADLSQVRHWVRDGRRSDDAKLAERAHWLSVLLRGRVHEYVATATSLSLVAHPIRKPVQRPLNENAPGKPVFKSEEIFTKIIIGAALRERDPENRVVVWADTISKARNAILTGGIALPQTVLDSHAQDYAFKAAKALTVGGHSNILARAVDLTTSIGFPALLALTVPSWIFVTPVAPIATQAVRYFSGASLGDHIAKAARSTRQNFRMLANLPPGRIERHLGNITHI